MRLCWSRPAVGDWTRFAQKYKTESASRWMLEVGLKSDVTEFAVECCGGEICRVLKQKVNLESSEGKWKGAHPK